MRLNFAEHTDDAREAELEAGLTHALDLLSRMEEQTIALYQEKQGLEQEIETVRIDMHCLQFRSSTVKNLLISLSLSSMSVIQSY